MPVESALCLALDGRGGSGTAAAATIQGKTQC